MTFSGLVFLRHDLPLTALSVAISAAACLCGLKLRLRVRYAPRAARAVWFALAGAVLGVGAWAAELLLLAGVDSGSAGGFAPGPLLAALLVAVGGATTALVLGWSRDGAFRPVIGGLTLTAAFAGLRLFALLSCTAHAVTFRPVSLCLANGLAAAAAVAAFRIGARELRAQLVSAGLMGVALWSVLALSGGAGAARPDPALAAGLLSPQFVVFLAVMLGATTVLSGFGADFIDDASSRVALQRTRRLADAAREGILVVSEAGLVLDANAAAAAMAGRPVEAMQRQPLAALLELPQPLEPGGAVESVLRAEDGEAVPVEVYARPFHHRDEREDPTSVVVVRDLREQRAVEQRLRFLSEHDTLTGLPNRAALRRMVEEHLEVGALLLFVRVLNHAETNSLLGHAAGDAVLEKLGERLKRMATGDTGKYVCMAARLGGAEFAFAAGGEMEINSPFPRDFARALARAIVVDGHVVEPQIRVGVACAPFDSATADELFRHAEAALEVATRSDPSDSVIYFRQDLQDDLKARRTLIHELRNGIAADELVVHYQPQVRTRDGRLCGFEALVRWMHPTRGFMAPDSFIPLAEESGLIVELGEYVLRRACADAMTWPAPAPVAVNLSPLQVHQTELPRLVHEVLLETGLPSGRLELEITEGALFRDFQRALDTLRRIKGLGVKVAMDDFGTGFSSLSTLQSFPFDKIKIDKSFVGAGGERASVIVKAVLGIGRGLDIPVVAEGVETSEQMAFLRDEHCEAVQGYLIGRPAPIEAHAALFDAFTGRAPEPKPSSRRAA